MVSRFFTGLWCAMFGYVAMASSPVVSNVTISPPSDKIYSNSLFSYDISSEPGIVTFHIETNGVPVDCPYLNVSGDMNMLVHPGTHSFRWRNDLDLPDATIRSPSCRIVVKAWSTNSPPDYLVYNLETPSEAPRYYAKAADVPGGVTATKYKTTHLVMRRIHAAGQSFLMGSQSSDPVYAANAAVHEVAFTRDFYIGIYEVTIGQMLKAKSSGSTVLTAYKNSFTESSAIYNEVKKTTDLNCSRAAAQTTFKWYWFGAGYSYPSTGKTCMSGGQMQAFRTATGNPTMFLPTSYQWEFACRAGSCMRLYSGSRASSGDAVDALGWHTGNNADDPDWYNDSDGRYLPHVVGLKAPNAWGLYDMLGNVDEMCVDAWAASPIRNADGTPVVDPVGPWVSADTTQRVVRGGNLMNDSKYLCAGYQFNGDPTAAYLNRGFRLACDVEVSR